MASERDELTRLRGCWSTVAPAKLATDYSLLAEFGGVFAARSRSGHAGIVIPVAEMSSLAVGRRTAGCELIGHASIRFEFENRAWDGPAAALICTDADLVDAFAVLAVDVLRRVGLGASWQSILTAVEEWQALLAPRGRPSSEAELGLWGELWFLNESTDISRALAGWRGPERDSTDFFVDGIAVEVKTSKQNRRHHVSQSQVAAPVGSHDAWLLSVWVKLDPGAATTVPLLADQLLARALDPADALRRLARAGFSPSDRREYSSGFVVLDEPEWYAVSEVPRVHAADVGVSDLRYRIVLDGGRRADPVSARRLREHFHGRKDGGLEG